MFWGGCVCVTERCFFSSGGSRGQHLVSQRSFEFLWRNKISMAQFTLNNLTLRINDKKMSLLPTHISLRGFILGCKLKPTKAVFWQMRLKHVRSQTQHAPCNLWNGIFFKIENTSSSPSLPPRNRRCYFMKGLVLWQKETWLLNVLTVPI